MALNALYELSKMVGSEINHAIIMRFSSLFGFPKNYRRTEHYDTPMKEPYWPC